MMGNARVITYTTYQLVCTCTQTPPGARRDFSRGGVCVDLHEGKYVITRVDFSPSARFLPAHHTNTLMAHYPSYQGMYYPYPLAPPTGMCGGCCTCASHGNFHFDGSFSYPFPGMYSHPDNGFGVGVDTAPLPPPVLPPPVLPPSDEDEKKKGEEKKLAWEKRRAETLRWKRELLDLITDDLPDGDEAIIDNLPAVLELAVKAIKMEKENALRADKVAEELVAQHAIRSAEFVESTKRLQSEIAAALQKAEQAQMECSKNGESLRRANWNAHTAQSDLSESQRTNERLEKELTVATSRIESLEKELKELKQHQQKERQTAQSSRKKNDEKKQKQKQSNSNAEDCKALLNEMGCRVEEKQRQIEELEASLKDVDAETDRVRYVGRVLLDVTNMTSAYMHCSGSALLSVNALLDRQRRVNHVARDIIADLREREGLHCNTLEVCWQTMEYIAMNASDILTWLRCSLSRTAQMHVGDESPDVAHNQEFYKNFLKVSKEAVTQLSEATRSDSRFGEIDSILTRLESYRLDSVFLVKSTSGFQFPLTSLAPGIRVAYKHLCTQEVVTTVKKVLKDASDGPGSGPQIDKIVVETAKMMDRECGLVPETPTHELARSFALTKSCHAQSWTVVENVQGDKKARIHQLDPKDGTMLFQGMDRQWTGKLVSMEQFIDHLDGITPE